MCDTFANKGLLRYALKKILLLEIRKSIDTEIFLDFIALGLPNYVTDKIDREIIQETDDLNNELKKLEYFVGKIKYDKNH